MVNDTRVLRASDLTEMDHREVSLWRRLGRWEEARTRHDHAAMRLQEEGFRRSLANYEAYCREQEHG